MKKTHKRSPLTFGSFQEAFLYGWDRGIGLHTLTDADPQTPRPWTLSDIEQAFEARGKYVSDKTVENWRSGKTTPNRRNLLLLADIFANRDAGDRSMWMDRFTVAISSSRGGAVSDGASHLMSEPLLNTRTADQVPAAVGPGGENTAIRDGKLGKDTPPGSEFYSYVMQDSQQSQFRLAILIASTTAMVCALLFLVLSDHVPAFFKPVFPALMQADHTITELRFCTPEDFNEQFKRCERGRRVFPAGTRNIHVSFESDRMPTGQPFERRWYRDGQMFLQRDGFFDAAWENWTWLENPKGHDPGTYHLRIIVEGHTTTGGFEVEGE